MFIYIIFTESGTTVSLNQLTEDIINMNISKENDEEIACSTSGSISTVIIIKISFIKFLLFTFLIVFVLICFHFGLHRCKSKSREHCS